MQYRSVTVLAPAKLNLSLDVVGTLPNGYHDLDMVMQTIDLYEKITLRRSNGLSLTLPGSFVPVNDKNTAIKAALAFFDYTGLLAGVDITIYKNTPVRAGMAGGSADAAGHGSGRAQQRQQRVEADEVAHDQTDDVLQGDQQAGCNGDHGSQLAASLLQQLGREAVADTHEEDVLGQVLDIGRVKRKVDNVHTTDDGQDDGNDQTCNNRCGDAVLLQEFAVADHPMAEEDDASRNAQSHHVVELVSGDGPLLTNGGQFAKVAKQIHNIILLSF